MSKVLDGALECLEKLLDGYSKGMAGRSYYDTIKQALLKAQEQEKENARYKQLEEQLGCPLEVVVKAMSNGIYVKDLPREDLIKQFGLKLSNIQTEWYLSNNIMCVNLKDYKTSFWLKEDKSE